jgi:glycosyltransferase involved in cell wall biosynthesis
MSGILPEAIGEMPSRAASHALNKRPRALLTRTTFEGYGGAEALGAWMVEALKSAYELTVLTWTSPDLDKINALFGTSIKRDDVRWMFPGALARSIVGLIPDETGQWQKRCWLMRLSKRIRSDFDIHFSSDSEFDFGEPGIQYVHYPCMGPNYADVQAFGSWTGWRILPALARRVYRPWMTMGKFRYGRMLQNLTLAISNWTAQEYRRYYGRPAETLYPPAAGRFEQTPWSRRRDEFVAISRLVRDKNLHRIASILREIRREHPQIKLHIVGARMRTGAGEKDYRELRATIDGEADWIELHEDLPRRQLVQLLGEVRYGIHLFKNEHFGMGIAEMVRGGLIPFVHDSGGQVEIAAHQALRFTTDDEAATRISAILSDPGLREQVRSVLEAVGNQFTPEHFCTQLVQRAEAWRNRQCDQAALAEGIAGD